MDDMIVPEPLRLERGVIPVLPRDLLPSIVQGDQLVERFNAIRDRYPFVMFENDPTIHFLGWREVGEIFRNWPRFSSATKHQHGYKPSELPLIPSGYDPPIANTYKTHLMRKYGPEDAAQFEPEARRRASALIDELAPRGRCEYMEDFAAKYFGPVLLEYVGIPTDSIDRVQQLEQDTFRTAERDPDGSIREGAGRELASFLIDLTVRRRHAYDAGERRGDLIDFMLSEPMGNGKLMTDGEIKATLHIMCLGGAHSVKAALGYAMKLLADNAAARATLRRDGVASASALEELLRWNGVGGGMTFRTVVKDGELAGCPLRGGDKVATVMTAANHDPAAGDDVNTLDLERGKVKSFTFAFGVHRCLGIHFARLGLKVAVEEWHKRIPEYRVLPGAELPEQIWAGVGYLSLPLEWPTQH